MYIFLTIFLLVTLSFVILFHFRKKKIIKKVCLLSPTDKCSILDDICYPLGYDFNCRHGIFSTHHAAWQKEFGYTHSFDRFAPFFNMVFDALPVYFDYNGKTWLIEFWKGQYGITTGCEIGVYHADEIGSETERKRTLFKAISPDEMLNMAFTLRNSDNTLATMSDHHWWLTAFCLGIFNRPDNLLMDITIAFPDCEMLQAFVRAIPDSCYTPQSLSINGRYVSFTFDVPRNYKCNCLCRLNRRFSLWRCKTLCKLYNRITRPFDNTDEKLLYLYFYIPFAFRRTLVLHGRNHRNRRQHKKLYHSNRTVNIR